MAGRRYGQHFLTRKSILEQIAAECAGDAVVEIGPGKGALTHHLLPLTERLIAIEIDQVLVHYLQQKFQNEPKLTILNSDVLKVDLSQWGPVTVSGNLPYYITSPIVEKVLRLGPLLRKAVFLVQKEVAERIAASPGSRDYGYLSVQVQAVAETKVLFGVPSDAFRPPPKVDSAVIELVPRVEALVPNLAAFLSFVSLAFRHKRKTLRNNLSAAYRKEAIDAQPEAGMRAEQLSALQFVQLQDRILRFP